MIRIHVGHLVVGLIFAHAAVTPCVVSAADKKSSVRLPQSGIVVARGKVQVLRKAGTGRVTIDARPGMPLVQGDLLSLSPTSAVTIVCADGTTRQFHGISGTESTLQGLPRTGRTPFRDVFGIFHSPPRDGTNLNLIPQLISPRAGKLLSCRPRIRWTPALGATRYTVKFDAPDNGTLYQGSGTTIAFPTAAPSLIPGTFYRLAIETDGNRSSLEESSPGIGFTVLSVAERTNVLKNQQQINGLHLPAPQTRFILAQYFASQDLHAEAIDLLEQLSAQSKEPAVFQLAGDLYLGMGLYRAAEEKYSAASMHALASHDKFSDALAQAGLGYVYEAIGNNSAAMTRWSNVLEFYSSVHDQRRVRDIQSKLALLRSSYSGSR